MFDFLSFPLILVILTVLTGFIWITDYLYFSKKRVKNPIKKLPWWVDYSRSFFPVLLLVLIIRSFLFQIYVVPTGSLVPTVWPVEFLLVSQFSYGVKLPIINTKIINISEPKRGDIAVFLYPPNPKINYIKRVIGLPGDEISYNNHQLIINKKMVNNSFIKNIDYQEERSFLGKILQEDLPNKKHLILIDSNRAEDRTAYHFVVPKGYYFMMGDNRDDSSDSRFWGLVPERDLIGKAYLILLSWDRTTRSIRWSRMGRFLD